MVRCCAIASLE
jgi:hypothetical protein